MKKIAVRGMIILAVVVACSMFFAQTIVTITTPKIKIEVARQGKFEDKMNLTGKIYFEETQNVTPEGIKKNSVMIDKLYVKAGDYVEAGTLIADATLSNDYESTIKEAQDALQKAQTDYRDNEIANIRIVDNTDSDKNHSIRDAEAALTALYTAQEKLINEAALKGVALTSDAAEWAKLISDKADPELMELMELVIDAQLKKDKAEKTVLTVYGGSRTKKDLVEFIEKRVGLQKAIDDAEDKLLTLISEAAQAQYISATSAGYITELNLVAGNTYDGTKAAYVISVDCEPVLRCDVTGNKREFTEGMRADIKSDYNDIKSSVSAVAREGVSGKFLHVALEEDTITRLGGMRALMDAELGIKVTYKSKQNSTLLPASTVRSEGENMDFVYVIDYEYDFWGTKMKLRKQTVTVIERSDSDVSVSEEMRGTYLADKEDRAIEDEKYVMEYVN